MNALATPMTKKPNKPTEHCRYAATKIDAEVLRFAKAAALVVDKTFQEWLSDLANQEAAKVLARQPVNRKPPPIRVNRPRRDA